MPEESIDLPSGSFFESENAQFEDEIGDRQGVLNIVVIGKVSSGKSSLINSLLGKTRKNSLFKVRAESGITGAVHCLRLNQYVRLIDSPGLDDVRAEYSAVTRQFLPQIDIGIFVVEGSSDSRQKKHLDDLKQQCEVVFVVLNKIDEYDKWQPAVLERVVEQWKKDLGVADIYPTCTFGYDPEIQTEMKLDVRGIDELRRDIEQLLRAKWHKILTARSFESKKSKLVDLIARALLLITEQAFTPRQSPSIIGTLATAIADLQYLWFGKSPSGADTKRLIHLFTAGDPLSQTFLWHHSLFVPDFILDLETTQNLLATCLAILATVVDRLQRRVPVVEPNADAEFQYFHYIVKARLEHTSMADLQTPSFWSSMVSSLLSSPTIT